MNDSQSTAGSDSSQYGATRNPQTPGGQDLSNTASNLQTTTPNLFSGNNNVSITSVGDTSFVPFTSSGSSTASVSQTIKKANHHYAIIIGSCLLILFVIIVSWLMVRNQPNFE